MSSNQLQKLLETVRKLRAPNGGCPWDKEQTFQSLRPFLVEECYELLDVLDQVSHVEKLTVGKQAELLKEHFKEELGDVLLQILLHSQIASESAIFDFNDVAGALDSKLIRRHPHVFGDQKADSSSSAYANWEREKQKEKASKAQSAISVLAGVPKGMPAIPKAQRIIEKVTRVGFQWKDAEGPEKKVEEEWAELKKAIQESDPIAMEHELGDLLFSVCNLAFMLKLNPEQALRKNLERFQSRFGHVERQVRATGAELEHTSLDVMDFFWDEAKRIEKRRKMGLKLVGLTGGVASGKTVASKWFSEQGYSVLDADQLAKKIVDTDPQVQAQVQGVFKTLDRKSIREQIFNDPEKKLFLERLLHPKIAKMSEEFFDQVLRSSPKKGPTVVFYEAALLFETGRYQDCDETFYIDTPEKIRRARLVIRDGISTELADKMIAAQSHVMDDTTKKSLATWVVENTGNKEEFKQSLNHCLTAALSAWESK